MGPRADHYVVASTPANGKIDFPVDGLGDLVVTRIARFDPRKVPAEVEAAIGALRRQVVAAAGPDMPERATEYSSRFTQLAWWAYRSGVPLVVEEVLHPDNVDCFLTDDWSGLEPGSQATYRSLLRRLGRLVLGPPLYPNPAVPTRSSDPTLPYTEVELAALVAWARGLQTELKADGAIALLGLASGAGLTSSELNVVVESDIECRSVGLSVVVRGDKARSIPVRCDWEWAVEHAVERARGGLLFQPHRERSSSKHVSRFVEHVPTGPDVPKLVVQRLRATWIVGHLNGRVPQNVLAAAAGVEVQQVAKYMLHMAPFSRDAAESFLRGRV